MADSLSIVTPSVVGEVFGNTGTVFHEVIGSLALTASGTTYDFMELEAFRRLAEKTPGQAARVYWTEMLGRAHWAAMSNVLRHKRWQDACIRLFAPEPNYLGFAASLRGLLEASADAFYSLGSVPLTLANIHSAIESNLSGNATCMAISRELEQMLIHFHYGRRAEKKQTVPDGHRAETATTYLRGADGVDRGPMMLLYEELCQLAHPAAQSLLWMVEGRGEESIVSTTGDDRAWILNLCERHRNALDDLQMNSVNTCILILKVLNKFPIRRFWTEYVDTVRMDAVPMWTKVRNAFSSSTN
jgi:hypothetical protein